ncbi:hypothetical protein [Methylocella silvestris]|uniref:hypothetical protein n=1 Tax=Methylocella silvestris TaxID=199596 RepID=UPI0011AFCBD2|nr:hypothetical protein [Methylocella silvestris]
MSTGPRQTLASVWGAIELFINDVLIASLNQAPALAGLLISKAPAKRHFQGRSPTMETLADRGFDLSRSMGDILFSDRTIASLEAMRDVFAVLAGSNHDLHCVLNEDALWLLWQRRHVVVHRGGIVDRVYCERTGDRRQIIGQPLAVSSSDVNSAFGSARRVATALLSGIPFSP